MGGLWGEVWSCRGGRCTLKWLSGVGLVEMVEWSWVLENYDKS